MESNLKVPRDRKIIVYDIDNTLNDFDTPFFRYLCDEHGVKRGDGKPYTEDDMKEYDIFRCISIPEKFKANPMSLFEDFALKGGYMSFEPAEGALQTLEALSHDFVQIAATSRAFSTEIFDLLRRQTYDWLSLTGMSKYIEMVFFTSTSKNKEYLLKELFTDHYKLKIVVEDKLGTALHATEAGIHSILLDRRQNRNGYNLEKFEGMMHRVNGFDEAYKKIRELEERFA